MPKILGMEPHTAKWVGIAGVGAVGLYLFTHRSSGGSSAPTDSGAALPATGPIPSDTGAGFFSPAEQAASQASQQLAQQSTLFAGINPMDIHGTQANGQPWSLGTLQQTLVGEYEQATGGRLPGSLNTAAPLPPSPETLANDFLSATGQEPPGWHIYPGQGQGTAPKLTLGNLIAPVLSVASSVLPFLRGPAVPAPGAAPAAGQVGGYTPKFVPEMPLAPAQTQTVSH